MSGGKAAAPACGGIRLPDIWRPGRIVRRAIRIEGGIVVIIRKLLSLAVSSALLLSCACFAGAEAVAFDPGALAAVGDRVEFGPYTVEVLGEGVYHIEDGVEAYPPGFWYNEDGSRRTDENGNYLNNCSDMYLIVGSEKALLIDLSNKIDRDGAAAALVEIVEGLCAGLPYEIAITHGHPDHVGMWYAFAGKGVKLNFPDGDYAAYMADAYGLTEADLSPFTPGDATFDLGGRYVGTVKVKGHTVSSTVFVLLGENMMFSGDAIGSGSGVWIWGAEGLANFKDGMASLISYIEASYDEVGRAALKVYSGHAWQYGKFVEGGASCLDWQYIQDMESCINLVSEGAWFAEDSGLVYSPWETPIATLDCDFIYGTAAISATYAAACDYAGVTGAGAKRSDYPWGAALGQDDAVSGAQIAEASAYLDLFDEYTYEDAEAGTMTYYVYDPIKNGAAPNGTYPVLLWLHGAGNALEGKNAITYAGAEPFASPAYQEKMGGAYIICPLANEYRNEDGSNAGTWMTKNEAGTTSLYSNAMKGILDTVAAANPAISKTFVIGTSAGGYGAWRFIIDWTDAVDASLIMAGAYVPTDDELDKLEAAGFPIWITHGYHDELVTYDKFLAPVIGRLLTMPNVDVTLLKWVRNCDYSVATINFGIEMGQHCICVQIGQDLMYSDGTPYDPDHPDGVTGWIGAIAQAD